MRHRPTSTRSRVFSTIDLPAPPEDVWDAITAPTAERSAWDPLLIEFATHRTADRDPRHIVAGDRLRIRVALPGRSPMAFRPRVTAAARGVVLEWFGTLGIPGLLDGRHRFELQPLVGGGTRLIHTESFRGVLVPMLWRSLEQPTAAGFSAFNTALAEHLTTTRPAFH